MTRDPRDGCSTPATRVDELSIAVRGYVPLADADPVRPWEQPPEPSPWVLIFDTETTTDASQRLRFGSFQWRWGSKLDRHGLFYASDLSKREQAMLTNYAAAHGLELMTVAKFIENIIYKHAYEFRATIVVASGLSNPRPQR